jgi:hypothetical protein
MEDGGPGSGRYPKGSGEETEKKSLRQKLKDTLVGQKTADGEEIKSISSHATMRFGQRHIKPEKALDALQNPDKTKPGNSGEGNRTVYIKGKTRVVFDHDTQEIKTVYNRNRGG